jgi:hypothetical protein
MDNKPVAWGMLDKDGGIYDSISPEEHDREEGAYTIPLYTHPAKELDEQFKKGFEAGKEEGWKAHKFHHSAKTLTEDTECQYCKQGCIRCDARKLLTDEEITQIFDTTFEVRDFEDSFIKFARAILKKASEK